MLDKEHGITHIDFAYGATVLALEFDNRFTVRGGVGIGVGWPKEKRLAAYKEMRCWLDDVIQEIEGASDEGI